MNKIILFALTFGVLGCGTTAEVTPKETPISETETIANEPNALGDLVGDDGSKKGTLTKSEISTTIKAAMPKVKYCYEKELAKNPALAGALKVKFAVLPSGLVETAMATTAFEENVDSCVLNIINELEFPKPKGDGRVIVVYPFNFKATKAAEKEPVVGPVVMGSMSKELIRGVISKALTRIKYCYQKELVKNPTLEGVAKVKFIIAKSGAVTSATMSKSFEEKVDPCVLKVISGLKFPEPSGGGIVIVTYPFDFKTAKSSTP